MSCYVLADTFFIANGLGANGLASLNIALPIYSVVHGCGLMIGIGGSTKYSVFQSRGDIKSANKYFLCSLILAAVFADLFVLCGLYFSLELSKIMGADETLFEMTEIYIRVFLVSTAFLLDNEIICFVRNYGAPKTATAAMSCGSIANIFLDWLFVFPMNMGMFGAVFTTGLVPVISLFVLLIVPTAILMSRIFGEVCL